MFSEVVGVALREVHRSRMLDQSVDVAICVCTYTI
jgi:hypothetical protein